MASRGRSSGPGPGSLAARPESGRSRHELSLPRHGRRPGRAARRAQYRAIREADPGPAGRGRAARPWRRWPRRDRTDQDPASDGGSFAILARTNRELLPAVAVAIDLGRPFRCAGASLLVEDDRLDGWLDEVAPDGPRARPLLARLGTWREDRRSATHASDPLAAAVLGWGAAHRDLASLRGAIEETRRRLGDLRRDDAPLTLATVHGTKGLEWDHVAVLGMETGRFPSRRAVDESTEPQRALEEERRLAYVAWTRARRSLTLLYDPDVPSPFLLEAFDPDELHPPLATAS
ncbi:MAG: ATP-dependent helicase [Chloroflexi bacterium]|nr:MAG: ATP-dependent helicase [Chloroflexota bacterium]